MYAKSKQQLLYLSWIYTSSFKLNAVLDSKASGKLSNFPVKILFVSVSSL